MKMLDDADARTILLLAPAGYGKTTLARQWAKTLNGVVFLTLSSAHRDVSVLATDLGGAVSEPVEAFVRTYVEAKANPQRAGRSISRALAAQVSKARVQWLILDDYQELSRSPEAEQFLEALHSQAQCRFLISSRIRPSWIDARLSIYGEVEEFASDVLAMSAAESELVLGSHGDVDDLIANAGGWPAVIGLVAATGITRFTEAGLPTALHNYLTDELYRSADDQLRRQLLQIALAVDLEETTLQEMFGEQQRQIVSKATDLGFVSRVDGRLDLHPLFREYLMARLATDARADALVDTAIDAAVRKGSWDRAFQLILRFNRFERVESVLERAYAPLVHSGQLGTLSSFALSVRERTTSTTPVVDLAEAELALRDGSFEQAGRMALRVTLQLPVGHALSSRAHAIIGQSSFARGELDQAEAAYRQAYEAATTAEDESDALRSWALASIQGEVGDAEPALSRLAYRTIDSAADLLRYASVRLVERRFTGELTLRPPEIDEGLRVATHVRDPRTTSSFVYSAAYALGLRADYDEALRLMDVADEIIDEYDLDFARPYTFWNRAWISIGQRRFGNADRLLQTIEDEIATSPLGFHVLNCRILRARMATQTGRPEAALDYLPVRRREEAIPSIQAEYLATRALAFAISDDPRACEADASRANELTKAAEVRVLTAAARTITPLRGKRDTRALWRLAENLGTWDPLLAALRASTELADEFAACEELRCELAGLYERANDFGLARRAGLRIRSTRSPEDLLTPRELEVLEMLAHGARNRDIAAGLVLSPSTVKVHVRHIFEKLGVRTRAQAVARFELMRQGDSSGAR